MSMGRALPRFAARAMQRAGRMNTLSFTALAACLSVGAGSCSGGGGASSSSSSSSGGSAGNVIAPPSSTGNALVDRFGAAAARCGHQSVSTVPGGWDIVSVGGLGCTVWVPPGWTVTGDGTGLVSALGDAGGRRGFVGVAGPTTELAACAPAEARDAILAGFTRAGFSSTQVLWHWEGQEAFGGSTWSTGHAVFSMDAGSDALVGYLWDMTAQTLVACDVTSLGFWMPQASLEADMCQLLQIPNSVRCPSGGGCDDVECDRGCRAEGHAGGHCSSGCVCD